MDVRTNDRHKERLAAIARLRPYVVKLQTCLRLGHWDIELSDDPPETASHGAEVSRIGDGHWAIISLSDRILADRPEQLRLFLTHELLHVALFDLARAGSRVYDKMDPSSQSWASQWLGDENEAAVDHLGRAIAPLLPMPPAVSEER